MISRPLLVIAVAAFVIVGLLPVVLVLARVDGGDLAAVLDARTLSLLGRTLVLGLAVAALAVVIGVPFGFLVARTDVPLARVARPLGVLPLLIPPLVLAMSWAQMTSIRGGLGTVLVLAMSTFPIVALFAARAFERVDARREEAALLAGGLWAVVRMELPLVMPSALCAACFAFTFAVNDFAVPDYVSSIGPKWNVYADEVFATWRSDQDPGRAVAAALPLVVLTILALVPAIEIARRKRLEALGGDFRRPEPLHLGSWRWPALAFVLFVLGVAAVAPIARLVWESGGGPRGFSLATQGAAFARAVELGRANLQTSLVAAAGAALICVPIALVLGHALERGGRLARWAQVLVVVPIAVPAILFGIGEIATWNRALTAGVYDSTWMVVLLLVGRFVPFAILALAAGVAMVDVRAEEAARLARIGPTVRLARVVAPPLVGALAGGATIVFVLSIREIDAAILVPAANGTVMFRLYNAVHFGRDDFVAALALLVVGFVVLPALVWVLFSRRRLEVLP